jgi:hypothetical protein
MFQYVIKPLYTTPPGFRIQIQARLRNLTREVCKHLLEIKWFSFLKAFLISSPEKEVVKYELFNDDSKNYVISALFFALIFTCMLLFFLIRRILFDNENFKFADDISLHIQPDSNISVVQSLINHICLSLVNELGQRKGVKILNEIQLSKEDLCIKKHYEMNNNTNKSARY